MKDILYLGPVPCLEKHAEIGQPDYDEASKAECRAHIRAIVRMLGDPPDGAKLRIDEQPHELGTLREVVLDFDSDDKDAAQYADKCDANSPPTWKHAKMQSPTVKGAGDDGNGRTGNMPFVRRQRRNICQAGPKWQD